MSESIDDYDRTIDATDPGISVDDTIPFETDVFNEGPLE